MYGELPEEVLVDCSFGVRERLDPVEVEQCTGQACLAEQDCEPVGELLVSAEATEIRAEQGQPQFRGDRLSHLLLATAWDAEQMETYRHRAASPACHTPQGIVQLSANQETVQADRRRAKPAERRQACVELPAAGKRIDDL